MSLYHIFEYIQFVIGIIGVIGNVFVIIVFSRQALRKYSYSFYCLILAISDICFMTYAFIDWTSNILSTGLLTVDPLLCKISKFIPYYFGDFSIHLLTLIAIDRMLTIIYPRRFLVIKKRWFQSLIVSIFLIIVVSKNITIPINYTIVEINLTNSSQTIRDCWIEPEIRNIQMWITIPSFVILNVIINNWLNIKAIRVIMSSRRRVNGNAISSSRNSSLSSRDRKFAICSICLNLASMISKMPLYVCLLIVGYGDLSYDVINLIIKITGTITYIDNGFSFFINMFVNSLFYEEFLRLFGFRKPPLNYINQYTLLIFSI